MSSAKTVCPVHLAAASTLLKGWPITFNFLSVTGSPLCSKLDCFENLQISRTTANVSSKRFLDCGPARGGVLFQQGPGHEQNTGSAISALRGAQVRKCLLQLIKGRSVG